MYSRLYVLIQKNTLLNQNVSVIGIFLEQDAIRKKNEMIASNSHAIYEIHGPFKVDDTLLETIPEIIKPKPKSILPEIHNPFRPVIKPKPRCPDPLKPIPNLTDNYFKPIPRCPGPKFFDSDL